ncbi:unnamed protein product [Effrenium voratum]|nr:unnamed protein product [Effrenium voratum]
MGRESEKRSGEALRAAVQKAELEALRLALEQAVLAGTSWELIEWAHDKFREMENQAWKLRMEGAARAALQQLMAQNASAETLSDACEHAWQDRLGPSEHVTEQTSFDVERAPPY